MVKITIIIPTYKRYDRISKVVENVLKQDYDNFEVVIVDDNGLGTFDQEQTFKSIENILAKNNNVKYICLAKNSGACQARNRGIKEATGEYVAFLDDDDFWHPSFLTEMVSTINKTDSKIVYANFYRIDEHGIFYNRKEEYYFGDIRDNLLNGWCPATTSLFCINRNLLINYTGFNERLKNLEEYDLWIRLSDKNTFAFCDKRLVVKNETRHEQLTNNYQTRIQAWQELKKLWSKKNLSLEEQCDFFHMVDKKIKSASYYSDLQEIRGNKHIPIFKYGLKRSFFLAVARFFGNSPVIEIKRILSNRFGSICYLSKTKESEIKKLFSIDKPE